MRPDSATIGSRALVFHPPKLFCPTRNMSRGIVGIVGLQGQRHPSAACVRVGSGGADQRKLAVTQARRRNGNKTGFFFVVCARQRRIIERLCEVEFEMPSRNKEVSFVGM